MVDFIMESNREEAHRCIHIALNAKKEGDYRKAVKFLKKSIKLYPTIEATDLLSGFESDSQKNNQPDHNARSSNTSGRSTAMPDFSELHGTSEPESTAYTEAQKTLANRINHCKDYYEILGVQKDAPEADIKKAYRKMALQLHPDKNFAPGSTEAFKAVGKAFSVLNDSEKRRRYDLYGPEVVNSTTRRRRHSDSEDDGSDAFDPQELFNMFFGGGFPSGNVRVFRRGNTFYYDGNAGRRRQEQHQQQHPAAQWLQFLPIIALIVMTILGNILTPSPAYHLSAYGEYRQVRHTASLNVKYYVKSDFDQQYKRGTSSRRTIENMVESDYVDSLRSHCYNERTQKENLRRKGIYLQQKKIITRAENMKTPSCDRLEDIVNRIS